MAKRVALPLVLPSSSWWANKVGTLQCPDHHVSSVWIFKVNFVTSASFWSFALALSMLTQASRQTSTSVIDCIKGPEIMRILILVVLLVTRPQLVPRRRLSVLKYLSLNLKRVSTCAHRYSWDDWRHQAVKPYSSGDSWTVQVPTLPQTLVPVFNAVAYIVRARHHVVKLYSAHDMATILCISAGVRDNKDIGIKVNSGLICCAFSFDRKAK